LAPAWAAGAVAGGECREHPASAGEGRESDIAADGEGELRAEGRTPSREHGVIEIEFAGGIHMRLQGAVDALLLKRVLKALRRQ